MVDIDWNKWFDRIVCLNCIDIPSSEERAAGIRRQIHDAGMDGKVTFADMVRFPYIRNIVRGFAQDDMLTEDFNPADPTFLRSLDYSLNLFRILKQLKYEHVRHVLFFEDDVAFINDGTIVKETLDSCPEGTMIRLYDGYINGTQERFFSDTKVNDWWDSYLMMWNIDMFSLTSEGIDYMIEAFSQKLVIPDYYTWACPGTLMKLMHPDLYVPKFRSSVSHLISHIPLAMQNPIYEECSLHGNKNAENLIKYEKNLYNS